MFIAFRIAIGFGIVGLICTAILSIVFGKQVFELQQTKKSIKYKTIDELCNSVTSMFDTNLLYQNTNQFSAVSVKAINSTIKGEIIIPDTFAEKTCYNCNAIKI